MLRRIYIFLCIGVITVWGELNTPLNEDAARTQIRDLIESHCTKIQLDRESADQLMKYFNYKDFDNTTACDFVCDAYNTSTLAIADVILKSDGDLRYIIEQINNLLQTAVFTLTNDQICVDIFGFNNVSQTTINATIARLGRKNKVAAYMLRNLLDIQNKTNYPLVRERILNACVAAEKILLAILKPIDGYHKYLRNNEHREALENGEVHLFDDDYTKLHASQTTPTVEHLSDQLPAEKLEEKERIAEYTKELREDINHGFNLGPNAPRLSAQLMHGDAPIAKLKETLNNGNGRHIVPERGSEETPDGDGRARQLLSNFPLFADKRDQTGMQNAERLEEEKKEAKEDKQVQNNARTQNDDADEDDDEDVHGRDYQPMSSKNHNAPADDDDDDDDEGVQSRDFHVTHKAEHRESEGKKGGGIVGTIMNLVKGSSAGVLVNAKHAVEGALDGVSKLAVSTMGTSDNWFGRIMNYPGNFVAANIYDTVQSWKRTFGGFLDPIIKGIKTNDFRGSNPLQSLTKLVTEPIKIFVMGGVRAFGAFFAPVPLVGKMINSTIVEFAGGFMNRIMP